MRSIRWRLMLSYLGAISLSGLVLGVCLLYTVERSYVNERRQELKAHAMLVRGVVADATSGPDALDAVCEDLASRLRVRVILSDSRGTPLVDTARPEVPEAARSFDRVGCRLCHSETEGVPQLQVTIPMDAASGATQLTVLASSAGLEHTTKRIRLVTLLVLLPTLLLVSAVGLRLAQGIVSPVLRLNRMARRMAGGDLDQQVVVKDAGEIGELADSFNVMARHIRRAMNALAEEKQKIETVFTQMADGIITTDAGGRIVVFNPACERIFGVDAGTVIGCEVFGATFSPDLQRAITVALSGETMMAEMRTRYPAAMALGVHASPFHDADGQIQGAIVVMQDRTELRRLAELQRRFVADVSHELRTPVASVHATAETLAEGAKDDPSVRDRFIESLVRDSRRLSSLLEDLLQLSRLEARRGALTKEPIALKDLAADLAALFRPSLERRSLRFTVSVPASLRAFADRTDLMQVLANLVDNAIKYTPEGGDISLVARDGDGQTLITVSDSGIGIPKEEQDRVFERFYRVDKARSREMGGTGLGLAIAREIVEAHGGAITVDSEPGRGTTFVIALPGD